MKTRLFTFLAVLFCTTTIWAQTNVSTDQELRDAIADKADIKVTADIDLSNSTLSIPEGTTVTLDLGGHTLDRKLTKRGEGGGQVITVRKGATLHLSNGTLKGGWGGDSGGINNEGGTANLTDVNITNCTGDDRGGGICNRSGGTLTMTGGSITGNTSNDHTTPEGGGGIFNAEGAAMTLANVTITGNEAKVKGGGGICNYGTLTLDSCTVTGNSCKMNGGGIWQGAAATLHLKGQIKVTDNTSLNDVPNNLFLKTDAVIGVTGSLTGSTIGVIMEKAGTFTSGLATYHSGEEASAIFTSDRRIHRASSENGEGHFVVDYVVRSWNYRYKCVNDTTMTLTRLVDYSAVPEAGDYKEVKAVNGWFQLGGFRNDSLPEYYVVHGNVSNATMNVLGKNVHLILGDNTKLSLSGGILCYNTDKNKPTLYIHSQSYDANMGELYIAKGYKYKAAGIGSDWDEEETNRKRTAGDLEIHGGKLNVTGGGQSAGIGGGYHQQAGKITIYGGDIKAYGGDMDDGGAGIGGSFDGGGHLIIYDGTVYAQGGIRSPGIGAGRSVHNDLTATSHWLTVDRVNFKHEDVVEAVSIVDIYGGQVEAHGGREGAGIGGGFKSNGVILTVYDGDVKAYGTGDAAGIGGGWKGDGGLTVVRGGSVYAKAEDNGAGIGSGSEAVDQSGLEGGTMEVSGGHVEAYGGIDAAGIGGGEDADGGTVTISGGYVYAKGRYGGAGIGGGEGGDGGDVTITGGTVHASAGSGDTGNRAIGPGYGSDAYGSLTIGDLMMVRAERLAVAVERHDMCWYRTDVHIEPCTHQDYSYIWSGTTKNDTHTEQCQYCTTPFEAEQHIFEGGICTVCGVEQTFGGGGTGIENVNVNGNGNTGVVYDLNGRKMVNGNLPKGIYINNGKKVVIK